jgi:hypothetical protein
LIGLPTNGFSFIDLMVVSIGFRKQFSGLRRVRRIYQFPGEFSPALL